MSELPRVGLGTAGLTDPDVMGLLVTRALELGIRHFDTATLYGTEENLGNALKKALIKHELKRENIFITSKLLPQKCDGTLTEFVRKEVQTTLKRLGTDYLDLYLIHYPCPLGEDTNSTNADYRLEIWREFERLKRKSVVRHIGVSNFECRHIDGLLAAGCALPYVNQIEVHPFYFRQDIVRYCQDKGIRIVAHSPFAAGEVSLIYNPTLQSIADRRSTSVQSIILAWLLAKSITVIPKPTEPDHVSDIWESQSISLDDDEIKMIDGLNKNQHYAENCTGWRVV